MTKVKNQSSYLIVIYFGVRICTLLCVSGQQSCGLQK